MDDDRPPHRWSREEPRCVECGVFTVWHESGRCDFCEQKYRKAWLDALKDELDWPEGVGHTTLTTDFTLHQPPTRMRELMLGMRAWTDTWPPPWPYFRIGPMLSQVWYRTVHPEGLEAFAEGRWHPERGYTVSTHGIETIATQEDFEQLKQAVRVLHLFDATRQARRGRPPDSGIFPSAEHFHDAYLTAQMEFLHQGVPHPTSEQLAHALFCSKRALMAYQRKWGKP